MRFSQARLPCLCQRSPQHKDFWSLIGSQRTEQHRRQRFPTFARMRIAGVQAFLVGEALMRAPDPGGELARLFA